MGRVEALTDRWFELRRTWPSDGWDGAAYARANHNDYVKACEAELAALHEKVGHGPFEDTPPAWRATHHKCICQAGYCDAEKIIDPRHLKWGPAVNFIARCSLAEDRATTTTPSTEGAGSG